ncbi:SDR family NAD(P)-dependent oxidoreductase [Methylotuvimicrobium alcaliphilum]|uniref:Retinol dehydrogenase 13 n=1 Tax=Methylotuvimicrobium alcaliphilum (strain DSM 19304 / NCIMB 14124 / VKM B-2133 / 20Z) TaxID=1091494 RepID=G4SU49_META2|nr:SDR family NAD(P)-dependent oxidoreductase [Methylotuvimicrobium alcaliphilum]CCE23955.1 putative Retinol dehydrogenase 13 [Methylotuvimicrobium alcaliphilum 20Z]
MVSSAYSSSAQSSGVRVYLVTGATGAIGKAIARQLAAKPNSEVVLVCRDGDKAQRAVREIIAATGNEAVRFELADLSEHLEIRGLAERWTGPLHALINNAACTPRTRQETSEGIEMQFATNVLGYFRLIDAFADTLIASAPARIVNVASYWAGGLDLSDLEFTRRRYDNDSAYRQSKQADRMLSAAFSERLLPYRIAVNACHPGDVNSKLSNDLGFGGHETPDQGAETPVWLATDPVGLQHSGRYYEHKREVVCSFSRDREAVDSLYRVCSNYSIR